MNRLIILNFTKQNKELSRVSSQVSTRGEGCLTGKLTSIFDQLYRLFRFLQIQRSMSRIEAIMDLVDEMHISDLIGQKER